jgi:hypothetical protein
VPQYKLTPEFFALRRQSLLTRQAELVEHVQELEAINAQLASIDDDERLAAEMGARYEAKTAVEKPKRRPGRPRKPTPSRPVPSGPRWTAEELAAVAAGDPKDDEALAVKLDRTPGSIAKRRKMLTDKQILRAEDWVDAIDIVQDPVLPESVAVSDPPWPIDILAPPESRAAAVVETEAETLRAQQRGVDEAGGLSETNAGRASLRLDDAPGPVVETTGKDGRVPSETGGSPATPGLPGSGKPYKMIDDKDRRLTRPAPPQRGRPIEGGPIDNGPTDRRNYHPIHDASRDHS